MNKKFGSILCAALLVGCEISPKFGVAKKKHDETAAFDRFVFDDRLSFADSVHTHVEVPEMNFGVSSIDASGLFGTKTVEGTLDILPGNHTALFSALFLRYENFKHGAQQSIRLDGIEGVAACLAKLRLPVAVIIKVIRQIREGKSVSIPNILMPVQDLEPYGY
jgi:hypothetical protein